MRKCLLSLPVLLLLLAVVALGSGCPSKPSSSSSSDPDTTVDTDLDGVPDAIDNCPYDVNPEQGDIDGDHLGDLCDIDDDGDIIIDFFDNCPEHFNLLQIDTDDDGLGDPCDPDTDGDGILDDDDNCLIVDNPLQADADTDGQGDECDPDLDGDWVLNSQDNCPGTYNPDQFDTDLDGLGDACDEELSLPESRAFKMGVSPNGPTGMGMSDTMELAGTVSDAVVFSHFVDWDGTAGTFDVLTELAGYARQNGLEIVFAVEVAAEDTRKKIGPLPDSFTNPTSPDYIPPEERNFANPTLRDIIKSWCLDLVDEFDPEFIAVGVETDMYYFPNFWAGDTNPDGLNFVSLYKEIYNEIKGLAGSPATTVMTTFQWDQFAVLDLLGLQSLYNDHWSYVALFEGYLDLFAISTFPVAFPSFITPEAISDSYFTDIPNHVSIPVAIWETGWPSFGEGWAAQYRDEAAQARYIPKLFQLTEGLDLELLIWFFLTDPDPAIMPGLVENFYSSGLIYYTDGTEKQAFELWGDLYSVEYQPTDR